MSVVYRASTPQDEQQIIELLARAFVRNPSAHFLQPNLVRWKFWEPCLDWPEPRSWVAEQDDRIVAHGAMWPVTVGIGDNTVHGMSVIDWAADPEAAGAGARLLKKLMNLSAFTYSVGGSANTQAILPRLGYRIIAEAVSWSRPLRPMKRLSGAGGLSKDALLGLPGKLWWAHVPSKSVGPRWTVVEVNKGSSDIPVPAFERGPGFFDYLDRCPIARCLGFHILEDGRKVGWFALFVGKIEARVAGMWLEDPTAENWRIGLNLAQTAALETTSALEFVVRCTSATASEGAALAGMHLAKREPVFFWGQPGVELPPLRYQLCDNDDVFLNLL